MRIGRVGALLMVLLPMALMAGQASRAQQTSTPSLHSRTDPDFANSDRANGTGSGETSTLPRDVSGSYHFERDNESIEIDVVRNKLSGYISRLGDAETDANTPLTYFFDKSSVSGSEIAFQTRVLHGVWYSFRGTVLRGKANERDEDGYYLLRGVLIEHHPQDPEEKSANETLERRTVNFKSMGR